MISNIIMLKIDNLVLKYNLLARIAKLMFDEMIVLLIIIMMMMMMMIMMMMMMIQSITE